MRRYDTTFIINSQIGDDGIDASVKEIANLITSTKGSVLRENRIGSRRLAYEIARQTHGYYVSLIHDSESETLIRLDRHFKLGGNYLRHLTVRFDGDPFRKSITEIMMGFENKKRTREESSNGDSPLSAPVSPGASVKPATSTPAAPVTPVVSTAPEVPVDDTEDTVVTPVDSTESSADDESTL